MPRRTRLLLPLREKGCFLPICRSSMAVAALNTCHDHQQDPQRQDQVKAGEREDGNADQHPQGMIAIGQVDAVECAAQSLGDILRNLEIIIGIVAHEPCVGKVVRVGKSRIQVNA